MLHALISGWRNLRYIHRYYTHGEEGQGLVEYALIMIFVSVMLVILLVIIGPSIGNIYSNLVAVLENTGG